MDSKNANDVSAQPFSQAVVFSFLIYQVTPLIQADENDQLYVTGIILVFFGCINYTIHGTQRKILEDTPTSLRRCNNSSRIYIETVVVVVISYVLLLGVNWSYIWLAVFPLIAIGFIFTLRNELNRQSGSQRPGNGEDTGGGEEGAGKEMKKAERQEAAALVLYWVLCIMGSFHVSDSLAISQFLLFLSFMMGALTRMMTRLALTGGGVAEASVLLRKASLVVALVTVHAVAAELLGENVVLFVLPELAPILLWFSIHVDRRDGLFLTADQMKSHRSVLGAASAVVLALLAVAAASMDGFLLACWCVKALVSCGVSALLVYYVVFMLWQWPGLDSTAATAASVEEAAKLLKLWADTLLIAAAALLVLAFLAAVRLGQMVAKPLKKFQRFCSAFLNFIV